MGLVRLILRSRRCLVGVVCGGSVLGLGKSVGVHSRADLNPRWIVAAYEATGKVLERAQKLLESKGSL